jgi:type I restriction enzyme S subunit
MAKLRTVHIGDLGRIVTGKTPPSAQPELFGEIYPFLTPTDIDGFARFIEPARFLSPKGHDYQCRLMLPERAVCVVCIGATIGKICMTGRPSFTNQQINSVVVNEKEYSPYFIYYLLKTLREELRSNAGGAATPIVNKTAFSEIEVKVPPLAVQQRVAGILSAYDELMENSHRRIRLLEAMARALYREWFVNFRFPGHEKLPCVTCALGDIPRNWKICTLGDFVQFKSGFAFKSGAFTADRGHRLVTIRNVQDGTFNPDCDSRMNELPEKLPPHCVLEDGDILLSLTGNVGRVCLVYDGPFLLNQRVSKLVPAEDFDWAMTYCIFREPEMRVKLEQLSNGVAQQNLSPVLASGMEFARPPRELRQRFASLAEPMVQHIIQLYSIIQKLRRTRDLLLPKLMSGEIDVSGARGPGVVVV